MADARRNGDGDIVHAFDHDLGQDFDLALAVLALAVIHDPAECQGAIGRDLRFRIAHARFATNLLTVFLAAS